MEISTFIQDVAAERYPKEYWEKLPYLEEKTLRMKANTTFLFNEKVVLAKFLRYPFAGTSLVRILFNQCFLFLFYSSYQSRYITLKILHKDPNEKYNIIE